jgi:uncharacterized protein YjiS (DUF1127 family)
VIDDKDFLYQIRKEITMYRNLAIGYEGEHPARWIGHGLTSAIDTVRAVAVAMVRWHKRRATIRQLIALDDRTLKDIGLYRSDIHSVASERLQHSGGAARGDTLKFVI